MAVYIVAFAAVLVGLLFAWRSLGARASATPSQLDVDAAVASLEDALALLDGGGSASPDPGPRGARRIASAIGVGVLQASPPADDDAAAASALIAAAAEDCVWAARMAETAGYATSPGLQEGARALTDHARRCLAAVRRAEPSPAEPRAAPGSG